MLSNRNIDHLIMSGDRWAIDKMFALNEIGKYIADLEARAAGATIAELGISQRKAAMLPKIADMASLAMKSYTTDASNSLQNTKIPINSFAVLQLSGAMRTEGDWCSYGMRDFEGWIQDANNNPRIKGILIRANTGGGETLAGQVLRNAIADSEKPIVIHADFLASAGIDGTLTADEIIASGTSARAGSIGVYCSVSKKMVEWYKANIIDYYSDRSPQKNKDSRGLFADDPSALIESVNEAADIFHAEVKKYRPKVMKNEAAKEGAMFFANDAKKIGLVDGIGNLSYAFRRLAWHAGL